MHFISPKCWVENHHVMSGVIFRVSGLCEYKALRTIVYEASYSAWQISLGWIRWFFMWSMRVILRKITFPCFKTHTQLSMSITMLGFSPKILEEAISLLPPLLMNYMEEHFYTTSPVCSSHIPIYCPKLAL